MAKSKEIILIGYSGHAFVVIETFHSIDWKVTAYFDDQKKENNPYGLEYLGTENSPLSLAILQEQNYFIAIGSNFIRKKIYHFLAKNNIVPPQKAIHKSVYLSPSIQVGAGTLLSPNVSINAFAKIGKGVICNTASIIEHECQIGDFAHIAPGATLAGNVTIGKNSFIGANAVIKQGITIGKNVIVGAGTVIIKNIPDGATVVGNPGKIIKKTI